MKHFRPSNRYETLHTSRTTCFEFFGEINKPTNDSTQNGKTYKWYERNVQRMKNTRGVSLFKKKILLKPFYSLKHQLVLH